MYKLGSKFKINDNKIMLVASPDYKLVGVCPEGGTWFFQLALKKQMYGSSYNEKEILTAYNEQYSCLDESAEKISE